MKNKLTLEEKELRKEIRQKMVKKYYSNTDQLDGVDDNAVFEETNRIFEEERKKLKQNQES